MRGGHGWTCKTVNGQRVLRISGSLQNEIIWCVEGRFFISFQYNYVPQQGVGLKGKRGSFLRNYEAQTKHKFVFVVGR